MRLTFTEIESYVGDIVPLKLVCERDISHSDIAWRVDGSAVILRGFENDEKMPFTDGVLLTLCAVGEAVVTATLDGESYSASVRVRDMRRASPTDTLNYYIGDLHDHTCPINGYDEFAARKTSLPRDYISQVRAEGLLDFTAISDHSEPLNAREFFDNFFVAEEACKDIVVFPGCECDVTVIEEDRFGIPIKRSGEIVCFNSDDYAECTTWEQFYDAVARKPYSVCAFAHPQIVGFAKKGIWDFTLHKNNTPEMLRAVRMMEMGDGSLRQSNIIHEMMYSVALDNGFKISTTCSSDSHGPVWGYHRFPGKTVIMAPERTREAFLDAMENNRVYATESGNLKLSYKVNGITAPATLAPADKYEFRVSVSYFHEDESTVPVECRVISDKGKTVATVKDVDFSDFSFILNAPTAGYFYLRFKDRENRRTWSPPVWTGRALCGTTPPKLCEIDKKGFSARDLVSGENATATLNGDPLVPWISPECTADIVIDMGRVEKVSGLGHYPRVIWRELIKDWYGGTPPLLSEFPVEYTISASLDGEHYDICDEGIFRCYGSEEILPFESRDARYVRLTVHSNVATYKGIPEFADRGLAIGELTLYK